MLLQSSIYFTAFVIYIYSIAKGLKTSRNLYKIFLLVNSFVSLFLQKLFYNHLKTVHCQTQHIYTKFLSCRKMNVAGI